MFFGGFIVGIDWLFFNLFVLLFIAVPVTDPVILAGLNIVSIVVGMLMFETLSGNRNAGHSPDI